MRKRGRRWGRSIGGRSRLYNRSPVGAGSIWRSRHSRPVHQLNITGCRGLVAHPVGAPKTGSGDMWDALNAASTARGLRAHRRRHGRKTRRRIRCHVEAGWSRRCAARSGSAAREFPPRSPLSAVLLARRNMSRRKRTLSSPAKPSLQKSSGNSFITTSTQSELMCGVGSWLFMANPPTRSRATKTLIGQIVAVRSLIARVSRDRWNPAFR